MSDSDSDSRLSGDLGAENEGACGKLLEEIADQDRVVELDPIDVMVDRVLSFIDLDRALVTDEERAKLYTRMEEIGGMQEETVILFARIENAAAEVTPDMVSDEPKVVLIKPPVGGTIKVRKIKFSKFPFDFCLGLSLMDLDKNLKQMRISMAIF